MLTLNLLPQEQKEGLRYEQYRRATVFIGIALMAQLLIFCLLLVSAYFYVAFQWEGLARQVNAEKTKGATKKSQDLELNVSQIKKKLETFAALQNQRRPAAEMAEHVASLVPKGVRLKNFSFKKENKEIALTGRADTRADLLNFKNALERSEELKGVDVPIAALLRQIDIDFNIKIILP